MNKMLNGLKKETNFTYTENGALTHKSTESELLDMFALGGAYRERSEDDIILLFKNALEENETYALKCLFYLRDIREGQGERRFFRICLKWLAKNNIEAARRNFKYIFEFGRGDDFYSFIGTPLEDEAFNFMKEQFELDLKCKTPSLLGKWLASENASSKETKKRALITMSHFNLTPRQYRKALSTLRSRINIVEKLMSENQWTDIEFDKLPSRAGIIYRNAFSRRNIIKEKYEAFAKSKQTKVNANVLTPVDIAERIFNSGYFISTVSLSETERLMLQKYWDNLKDYYNGRQENGIAVVDVSGSMYGRPLAAAVSMGAYIAERGHGPFADHFITFSNNPELVKFTGIDITDKFVLATNADWGKSTNIEGVFDLLLNTAIKNDIPQSEIPERIYIFSDMEFNCCTSCRNEDTMNTLLESIAIKWRENGYEIPQLIFWNLNARNNNIPAIGGRFLYVSGFSMNMVETILSGRDGYDLMMEKLNSDRYSMIF